jgi:hypothetical protein
MTARPIADWTIIQRTTLPGGIPVSEPLHDATEAKAQRM